ncbi:AHH domain-containing protein [Pyxidicoccus xibeiensis]|uniref:AHH domain-containing protein n=1 Tax=Pyxidicoccus xibeiensis TaxID=2906759 RepID=UPI0020A83594|nr:AHH domain-containing protein [Pyxidicoccus xibeiensis]MCP3144191.1 AHH domain-containing protein [Pyxidicoccus xibeiensis]
MPTRLRWWALLLVPLVGCASARVVRLETGQGAPWEYVPPTTDRSVVVSEDAFEEALGRLALEVPLSLRPAEAGWLVRASTHGSVMDGALRSALRRDYGRWCHAHEGPSDCLSLLEDGLGLGATDRLQLSLGLSLEPMHESIADAVEDTLNPTFFKAVVVSALVTWAMLAANPEPVFTKAAATVAVLVMAYVGVDAFLAIVRACRELKGASDGATTFQELEEAGARFGRVVGEKGARIFVLAVALVVGKGTVGGATWLASRLPLLPGFAEAAALSASQLGVNLRAIGQVSAVAVVENGVVITLAPNAVAMVAASSGVIQGDPDGTVHHICTDKNPVSTKEGGPWTPQFEKIFNKAGMSLKNDPANLVRIRGHEGPHPLTYHREVFLRVTKASNGCDTMDQCRKALTRELRRIAQELTTPGSRLRRLITEH